MLKHGLGFRVYTALSLSLRVWSLGLGFRVERTCGSPMLTDRKAQSRAA